MTRKTYMQVGTWGGLVLAIVSLAAGFCDLAELWDVPVGWARLIVSFWVLVPPVYLWWDWVRYCDDINKYKKADAKHTHNLARNIWLALVIVLIAVFDIEGHDVPENSFSNYKSLGQLIDEFNVYVHDNQLEPALSKTSVEIRDMFAHGRILSNDMDGILILYKFGCKNSNGLIPVERVVTLDNEWLGVSIDQTFADIKRVMKASESLGVVKQFV
jgi:hypothetical protein